LIEYSSCHLSFTVEIEVIPFERNNFCVALAAGIQELLEFRRFRSAGGKTVDTGIEYLAGFTDWIEPNTFRVFSAADFSADINLRQFKFDGNESIVPIACEFVTAVHDFRMIFQQTCDVRIGNRDLALPWDAEAAAQQANHCPKTEKLFHKRVKLLVHLVIVLHAAKKKCRLTLTGREVRPSTTIPSKKSHAIA